VKSSSVHLTKNIFN